MTTVEDPKVLGVLAVRSFAVEMTAGDGRTVDVRIVPYGERIRANDGLGHVPRGVVYEEEILPGAFDANMRAPQHVHVNIEHEPGVAAKVGHGLALRSEQDGFYGSFRIHNTPVGETALELIRGGALGGVSMEAEFRPRWNRVVDGVVQRVRANLKNVALCRDPAYTGALILGLREEADDLDLSLENEYLAGAFPSELAERIERLGLEVPSELKSGHLVPDTSATADTSEATPPSS